ncbi:ATP-binding protein [Flavobacterium turcicum]|uniref:histidine kinase n=1 Tax=Flavobacterium turcicum TaxID=2764718 RepID=A0ABR7JFF5_9FLAO|nr:ATP-binding protein [Flavobacterium turcicum]MBC5863223.1 response regulator [Flavobacterium turcicum]NHL01955.1 response regulator [Flavobacterium turcicum]
MNKFFHLNTYSKLILLIASTTLFFVFIYITLYLYTVQEERHFYDSTYTQYEKEVKSLFRLNSKITTATIIDVTYWDELVQFTKSKEERWFQQNIVKEFEAYEADYVGIYGLDTKLINKIATKKLKNGIKISAEILKSIHKSRLKRFYLSVPEGIVEVFSATIHPASDPKKNKTKPEGYFIIARLLDQAFFTSLGRISSSEVVSVNSQHILEKEDNFIVVGVDLKDWKNQTTSKLLFKRPFTLNYKNTKEILFVVLLVSLLNILIYVICTKKWVYDPLKLVKSILETTNQPAITALKKVQGEFGYIGNLFEENNTQRKQLEKAKRKAEESDTLKSSFLANLSHEIRTPMNAIMGFSDLLEDDSLSEKEKKQYLKIIKDSGSNLVSIIEDLIEMSKIDANQIVPNYALIDLEVCIKELYSSLKVTIPPSKEIDFYIKEASKPLNQKVLTDETKLKQILINLITNAVKFTESGSINFGYSVHKKKGILEFTVEDTGNGISKDYLKVIFDRFRQIEATISPELTGLGLGLSITKAYVEMLGGKIAVKSAVGKGSIFSFTIPLVLDENLAPIEPLKVPALVEHSDDEVILVAEDDNVNYLLLKKLIQHKKYTVLRAKNGQEAVTMCLEYKDISLVFMDLKMPVLNGYEAFEQIRMNRPDLPVIAHTAYSSVEDKEKIMQFGFTSYISKPLQKEKVFDILDSIFADCTQSASN